MERAVKFLGRIVCKRFEGGLFLGVVDAVEALHDGVNYHITYADGDTEDINSTELKRILVAKAGTLFTEAAPPPALPDPLFEPDAIPSIEAMFTVEDVNALMDIATW